MSLAAGLGCERVAENLLRENGLRLLYRNYRCRWGELDLVMLDGPLLVIVEVRARRRGTLIAAEETVGPRKRARLIAAAGHLLASRPRLADRPVRFDVVAITPIDGDYTVRWLKDAFRQ